MGKQRYSEIPCICGYNAARERDGNYVGRQIAWARKGRGLSLSALSDLLRGYGLVIGRQGLGKWESGDAVPSAYQLLALCHALDIADPLNFFTGHPKKAEVLNEIGQNKLREYQEDLIASGRYAPLPQEPPIRYIHMPVSLLPASAGTGAFLEEENFELLPFPEDSVPSHADFGVRVSGDSMEPRYQDGQIVWVQQCSTLNTGEVGLFLYDGEGYIKVYEETIGPDDRSPRPVLVSCNKNYPPREISPLLPFSIAGKILS